MDYFVRAMRVEEIPLLNKQYEEHLVQDKEFWEEQEEERVRSFEVFFYFPLIVASPADLLWLVTQSSWTRDEALRTSTWEATLSWSL